MVNLKKPITVTHPEIMKYWDFNKNKISPSLLTYGSHKKVWWVCEEGHSWEASISKITNGQRCPYCSNRKVLNGFNDLATKFPQIAQDWDYQKNDISPDEVSPKSHKKVWWKCQLGHSWEAVISSRTNGRGCPFCQTEKHASFPEKAIYFYIKNHYPDAIENYKNNNLNGLELDIFIPSKNFAIEYDGGYWHSNIQKDKDKSILCKQNEIQLLHIRDHKCPSWPFPDLLAIELSDDSNKSLENAIQKTLEILNTKNKFLDYDINIQRDSTLILDFLNLGNRKNNIATNTPFAKEWDIIKNNGISPSCVAPHSNRKFWWKCAKGHSFQMSPSMRMEGNNCPICAGIRVISGINDLKTKNPDIAEEWNINKNSLSPDKVYYQSKKRVWWKCRKCNYEWGTAISNRTVHNSGCPVCAGKKIAKGINDLKTVAPEFLKYWNYEKNDISPETVGIGSHKKVWLVCDEGHEWEGIICNEIKRKKCPICSGRKIIPGTNDLLTRFPHLKEEWDFQNNDIDPEKIGISYPHKVWWKCKTCGYTWEAYVPNRTHRNSGCPKCARNKDKK